MSSANCTGVVVHSNPDKLCAIKPGQLFWVRKVEEEGWELAVGWRQEEDRGIAVWMEAAGDRGAARALDMKALRADGDALIRADFGLGAQAPDVGPPGAVWGCT